MDIKYIPNSYSPDLDLQHLRVLDVLLRERSLTRGAKVLDVSQPAVSKTLARLRRYFDDPLFVRVSHSMEPTPKALSLAEPVRGSRQFKNVSCKPTSAQLVCSWETTANRV